MKKLILSLLIFFSVISQAQIQIPQVVGLPSALNSKVDKVTGKSLVADTSIVKLTGVQAGAQVNKIEGIQKNGVDLTITGKKVNITVPTTASEIGAQPAGTYATGTGTAYNSNNGDETLTSIKTKLGAATSVSDGYLKYQDFVRFDGKLSSEVDGSTTNELQTISTTGAAGNITLSNSGGTLNLNVNDADASPTNEIQDLSLSGNMLTLSSDAPVDVSQATAVQANTAKVSNANHTGDVTGSTALTLATVNSSVGTYNNITINAKGLATAGSNVSYEPAFTKNTAFNKNFGTTSGTVLEGRTFGTAAGSAVGDFQPVENQRLSTTNSPSFNKMTSTVATGTAPFTVNSTTMVGNLNAQYLGGLQSSSYLQNFYLQGAIDLNSFITSGVYRIGLSNPNKPSSAAAYGNVLVMHGSDDTMSQLYADWDNNDLYLRGGNPSNIGGGGSLSAWEKLYHSGNLTSSLATNYIPKWNGSSFINSGIYNNSYWGMSITNGIGAFADYAILDRSNSAILYNPANTNNIVINSTTPSTAPTNGALVVGGGIGAGHVRANNFYGNGSNLTGIQLPITLTTNGTSGAATFSGNVLNVPNYNASSDVYKERTTVNGSTSGYMICSMPFRTGVYKKVLIRTDGLNGSATYTFPTSFLVESGIGPYYSIHTAGGSVTVSSCTRTSITLSSAVDFSAYIVVEGY